MGDALDRVDVPVPTLIAAAIVRLVAAVLMVAAPQRLPPPRGPQQARASTPSEVDDVTDLLVALGEAMVDTGASVNQVRESVARVAHALGPRRRGDRHGHRDLRLRPWVDCDSGKFVGYSMPMSIAIGLTSLFGFPGTMILSQEAAKGAGSHPKKSPRSSTRSCPR